MLQLKNTPGFSRNNLVMTHPHHKQIGQHSDANGFLTAVFVPADLVLAQPKARFQLPVHDLNESSISHISDLFLCALSFFCILSCPPVISTQWSDSSLEDKGHLTLALGRNGHLS